MHEAFAFFAMVKIKGSLLSEFTILRCQAHRGGFLWRNSNCPSDLGLKNQKCLVWVVSCFFCWACTWHLLKYVVFWSICTWEKNKTHLLFGFGLIIECKKKFLLKIPHRNINKVWLGWVVVNQKICGCFGPPGAPPSQIWWKSDTILFLLFFSQMHVFDGPYAVGRGSVEHWRIGKIPSRGLHGHACH